MEYYSKISVLVCGYFWKIFHTQKIPSETHPPTSLEISDFGGGFIFKGPKRSAEWVYLCYYDGSIMGQTSVLEFVDFVISWFQDS